MQLVRLTSEKNPGTATVYLPGLAAVDEEGEGTPEDVG